MKKIVSALLLVFCMGFFAADIQAANNELSKSDGCYVDTTSNRNVMVDQYVKGQQAFDKQDFSKAFTILKPVAEKGNPNAQYLLGLMYDFGYGVTVNHVTANEWYLKAARQGQDDAQFNLAISYLEGEGVAKDMALSVCWCAKSAANGDDDAMKLLTQMANKNIPEAQYAMAQIYRNGVKLNKNPKLYPHEADNSEIKPDNAKYKTWLKRAADSGHSKAKSEL